MNALSFEHVTFTYAGAEKPVLLDAYLEVPEGAFALLTGNTGSGKSTMLRLAKPEVAPAGELSGTVRAFGEDVRSFDAAASARTVGYVFQSPDAQMVCDTIWHEMAFGLENLGTPERRCAVRVAETATYLGMGPWFRDHVAELSGGRRQVLALASVLAMRPRALLLDEPTSMPRPRCRAGVSLALLFRANRELGMTVVVATHAPGPMLDYATCAYALEDGRAREVALEELRRHGDSLAPEDQNGVAEAPILAPQHQRVFLAGEKDVGPVLALDDVWFRYDRDADWVLRGCDFAVGAGEVRALLGANGCGKSTLLQVAADVLRPQRGRARNACAADQALLPQSPRTVLACETVRGELMEWSASSGRYGAAEVDAALERLGLAGCPDRNPYDLSGGQQQLLALEKLLLVRPRLLLLDEPTKGLDHAARTAAAERVRAAAKGGATVLLATHDAAFVRAVADTASLVFDGEVTVTEPADEFLCSSGSTRTAGTAPARQARPRRAPRGRPRARARPPRRPRHRHWRRHRPRLPRAARS